MSGASRQPFIDWAQQPQPDELFDLVDDQGQEPLGHDAVHQSFLEALRDGSKASLLSAAEFCRSDSAKGDHPAVGNPATPGD